MRKCNAQVFVDGRKVVKAGTLIKPTAELEIRAEEPKFVCRAGAKLEVIHSPVAPQQQSHSEPQLSVSVAAAAAAAAALSFVIE